MGNKGSRNSNTQLLARNFQPQNIVIITCIIFLLCVECYSVITVVIAELKEVKSHGNINLSWKVDCYCFKKGVMQQGYYVCIINFLTYFIFHQLAGRFLSAKLLLRRH